MREVSPGGLLDSGETIYMSEFSHITAAFLVNGNLKKVFKRGEFAGCESGFFNLAQRRKAAKEWQRLAEWALLCVFAPLREKNPLPCGLRVPIFSR